MTTMITIAIDPPISDLACISRLPVASSRVSGCPFCGEDDCRTCKVGTLWECIKTENQLMRISR
jgi:hypothetical protein